jgi:hypothetical protein
LEFSANPCGYSMQITITQIRSDKHPRKQFLAAE